MRTGKSWLMRYVLLWLCVASAPALERIIIAADGVRFCTAVSKQSFVVWGVNYDHDDQGRLLEDYWEAEWETVIADLTEIKALGGNVVRIHLQLGRFMRDAMTAHDNALARLQALLAESERIGLYLDLTGLGCYHRADIPAWYDALNEAERWAVQARFWSVVARACVGSPAVFCYDLMNEPVIGGNTEEGWVNGDLGGKAFVQRITRDLNGRAREAVAAAWVAQLTAAIRAEDPDHLITVGVIPWALVFGPQVKPLFYTPEAAKHLDFVSIHVYPKTDQLDRALAGVRTFAIGKPIVIEEFFPLSCSLADAERFIGMARDDVAGWVSFYWGTPADQLPNDSIANAAKAAWYRRFTALAPAMTTGTALPPSP